MRGDDHDATGESTVQEFMSGKAPIDCCMIGAAERMNKYLRALESAWINTAPISHLVNPNGLRGELVYDPALKCRKLVTSRPHDKQYY